MMEPHSVMKMKTTMEPKLTPARKEIFNDSFFIRKSIISDAGNVADPNPKQATNEQLSIGNCQSSIDNHKKNFIMKTFLRKPLVIAIAFVIANLFLVNNSFGQITSLSPWSNVYHGTSTSTQSITYNVPTGSNANRILVVAIASSGNAAGTKTVTLTYRGQSFTSVNGDMSSSQFQHTQLYYLKESGIDAGSGSTLSVRVQNSGAVTTIITDVWAAVFDGVDQTTPITDSKTVPANSNFSTISFPTALTVNANNQAVEVVSFFHTSTFAHDISTASNWTSQNDQTNTATAYVDELVANRSIPSSNTTDVSTTTNASTAGTTYASMTAMSLKPFVATITTNSVSGSPFCPGAGVSVPFAITGTYNAGNIFTAQLSNASGSFASPVNIGTLSSTTSGSISATIPANQAAGTGYRIRVVSSNPVVTGSDNGTDLTVTALGSWIGGTSSDWNTAANWSCSVIPTNTTDVTIPTSAPNMPVISSAAVCHNITFSGAGATLEITGGNSLTVYGNWNDNGGTFLADNTSTVTIGGTGTQTISSTGGSETFYNLTIGNTLSASGSINLNIKGNWTNNATFTAGSSTVTFNGTTQTIAGSAATAFNTITIANGSVTTGPATNGPTANTFNINNGGKYIKTDAGGIMGGTRNFGASSTYEIQNSGMSFSNIAFGNLIINFSGTGDLIANGLFQTVQGDLTIQSTGTGTFSLASTQTPTLNISGNLIVNGGTFNFSTGSGAPTVNVTGDVQLNGGTLQPTGSGGSPINSFNVSGNWTNNGGTFTPDGGTVNFNNNAADQTINGTAFTENFNNLTLNKNGNKLIIDGNIITVNVGGVLTFPDASSGIISTATTHILVITNTATTAISGGGATCLY